MTRLPVVEHLSHDEIDRRARARPAAAEKTRWHVLWLVTRPDPPPAAAAAGLVGFTPAWGRAILDRYNAGGPDALTDGRRDNGSDPRPTTGRRAERFAALQAEPPDGGLWAARGARPTSNGRHALESAFVCGLAHPRSGRGRSLTLPAANADLVGQPLAGSAGWADAEGRKVSVLVLDEAGGHTAEKRKVPPNAVLPHRPPCTPGPQPAERLWPLVREGLANRAFDALPKRTEVPTARCRRLTDHPAVVGGAVGFHWAVAA